MKNYFRNLLRALEAIRDALGGVTEAIHGLAAHSLEGDGIQTRVAALELELERRHAEAEGLLLKAQGKFDAARAAEERTRRLAESASQSEEEQLDALRSAYAEAGLPIDDGAGSEANGMQPVSAGLEGRSSSKSAAFAMKFGR